MRALVTALIAVAGAAAPLAHAQTDGAVTTDQPPRLGLSAPAAIALGETAGIEVTTTNVTGTVNVRLQRLPCTRVAGPLILTAQFAGGAAAAGDTTTPRRPITYRLCARARTQHGVLTAERILRVR